jgi:glutamyl-tRNA synthetase
LAKLLATYEALPAEGFTTAALEAGLKAVATASGVKAGALTQPARVACTGRLVGPSLYHLMEVLGRERTLARFRRAMSAA